MSGRRAAGLGLGAVALVGPTVLAFEAGAYFEGPRVRAGAVAWTIVIVALALGAAPPRGRWPRIALGGLTALAVLSLASIAWAPVAADADVAAQIAVLYAGALLAAALVMREPLVRRLAEPVLALGAVVVIGYGLAGRLLPGVLHLARSVSAQGRLEQPLTYWNAMGELAALGLVLAARIAGDRSRPRSLRMLAAAAGAPLGLGVYASFSRGALLAAVTGLIALVAFAPRREQLAGGGVTVIAAVLAALVISPLHGVTGLQGSLAHREHDGLIALAVLVGVGLAAAGALAWTVARVAPGRLALPRRSGLIATGLVLAGLAAALVAGAAQTGSSAPALSGGAGRLVSLRSDRYDYWGVALRAFAHEPVWGVGAGNWQVYWLRWRTIDEFAVDAHSLELQTLAELGVLGALALLAFGVGVGGATRRAGAGTTRPDGTAVAGAGAALVTYVVHSPLDWDWQMPAVTLVAIVLGGLVLAESDLVDADAGPGAEAGGGAPPAGAGRAPAPA